MKSKFLNGIGALLLSFAVIAVSMPNFSAKAADTSSVSYNYGTALRDSIIFYDANKCGKDAGVNNFFDWRGACHTEDGADVGYDLTGGYHDCGDHVKFGLTQGYSASVLEWEYYRYKDTFDKTGNSEKMLQQLKHFTDYFIKCHTDSDTFYYQVGDGTVDHTYWGAPEDQTTDRATMFKADPSDPAADVVGEASAALSLMYLNYKDIDSDYSATCLKDAKELYAMGKAHPGLSKAQGFYSSTTYKDDMAWAATWLYTITKDETYLDDSADYLINQNNGLPLSDKWTMCWDDMFIPAEIRMYELTGQDIYKQVLSENIDYWENDCKTTAGGLKYLTGWGVLRYSAAEAMVAMAYYEDMDDSGALELAKSQIDYILGSNPENISYMIGFGNSWPQHPHHRAANGYTYIDNGNLKAAKHLLLGGLIGGPDSDDTFDDDGSQYQFTETGIDYDAGLVGALAALTNMYGSSEKTQDSVMTPASLDFDKNVPADITIPTEFNGNTLDNIVNDAKQLVKGTDYTVDDNCITIKSAYFAAQKCGNIKLTFLFSGGKIPSLTFNVSDSGSGGSGVGGTLEVQMFNDSTQSQVNGIVPRIQILNAGNKAVDLSEVTLHYYYTEEGSLDENFWCDWATAGSANVTGKISKVSGVDGVNRCLEIGFTSDAGKLGAGASTELQARVSKADWSNYDQTNDYSFNPDGTAYMDWMKMTGYVDGQIQWGTEPTGTISKVENSEISPTTAAFDKASDKKADIPVTVKLNGNTFDGIYNGTAALVKDTDYTVSDDGTVTLLKSYFSELPVGTVNLLFKFSAGDDCVLGVTVADSSSSGGTQANGKLSIKMFNSSLETNTNSLSPHFMITNNTTDSIDLSSVKLRYYYTSDGNKQQDLFCDWASAGTESVTGAFSKTSTASDTADTYLELGFTSAAGTLAPGDSTEIQVRIANADWSNYDQSNDYSFDSEDTDYAANENVTGYVDGILAYGVEP